MKKRTKWTIAGAIALAVVIIGVTSAMKGRNKATEVRIEKVQRRDLVASVTASGQVQPHTKVDISADISGRIVRLAVKEGQMVTAGQFLLEIDPKQLEGVLQRGEASVAAAQSSLASARTSVEQGRANLELARQNLKRQQDLWKEGLTTRENLERAQNDVTVRETDLRGREQDIETNEARIRQEQASLSTTRYNLNQIIMTAPMDGLVTRRSIEEGETAVLGTMNNAGSVLLTIADMSVIEAEVEVDETEIPTVTLNQEAKVTIDAVPNRTFKGHVTEIGNSPVQTTTTQNTGQRQATTFKVVVTLDEQVPDIRPGFTCTAEITTAKRKDVVSVPIQALTVREMLYNDKGEMVRETSSRRRRGTNIETPVSASNEPPPGHTRKETEGVFAIRDGKAIFLPVKVGIAGEQYFEVLTGLNAGDQVITGPFASVRELADGENVRIQQSTRRTTTAKK